MLYMLIQLILLRVVSITSGRVRMNYMIIMLKFMEPEAEVNLVQNFYSKICWVCNWEAGKEGLPPAPVYSLRLRRLV